MVEQHATAIGAERLGSGAHEAVPVDTFEAIYATHFPDVYRYVLFSTRRPDDAEDIVSETFDRAFVAWRSGRGAAGKPLPWLIVIARRIIVDRWRRARSLRWVPMVGARQSAMDPADPDDPIGRADFWLWLHRLAAVLPDRQREVIFLRYQRDLTDADIGEILGLSASGVRSLVSRALSTLRRHPELWS
jgi:RNA polymerase sigma factor (sigma-70 family)